MPQLDLLIINASLPDGRNGMSVAVLNGKITEVTAGPIAGVQATETVDAGGYLLSPHFCRPALPHGRHAELRPAAYQ